MSQFLVYYEVLHAKRNGLPTVAMWTPSMLVVSPLRSDRWLTGAQS